MIRIPALMMIGMSLLSAAESFVLPVDAVTAIILKYRNGDEIRIDASDMKVHFIEKVAGRESRESVLAATGAQIGTIKGDLMRTIVSSLTKGMFTKESSSLIGATIHFGGPSLDYTPKDDNVADEIADYGTSIKRQLSR